MDGRRQSRLHDSAGGYGLQAPAHYRGQRGQGGAGGAGVARSGPYLASSHQVEAEKLAIERKLLAENRRVLELEEELDRQINREQRCAPRSIVGCFS